MSERALSTKLPPFSRHTIIIVLFAQKHNLVYTYSTTLIFLRTITLQNLVGWMYEQADDQKCMFGDTLRVILPLSHGRKHSKHDASDAMMPKWPRKRQAIKKITSSLADSESARATRSFESTKRLGVMQENTVISHVLGLVEFTEL